jgi:hypothetical protein
MAKAIASGDPRLMQKAGLEADIARLERLRSAHQDDQFAIRRQIRDAERDIEHSTRRIDEIGKDLARLVPTTGEAFRMQVGKDAFTERKLAGSALMTQILTLVQLQHAGDIVVASLGGFDLEYSGERFGQDGYRYATMLVRTGGSTEIELPVTTTPLGAIAKLEHVLASLDEEQDRARHRLAEAERRLASYRSREGGAFAFSDELAAKRRHLSEIEESLAQDIDGIRAPEGRRHSGLCQQSLGASQKEAGEWKSRGDCSQIGWSADAGAQSRPSQSRPVILRRAEEAPLGQPGRDARPQLHRPARSAGPGMSSERRRERTGEGPCPQSQKEHLHGNQADRSARSRR